MNKTLMLVICDFLLLSMLALARFDPPEPEAEPTLDASAASATAEAELIDLLEESLQSELSSRENLTEDLTETRQSLQEKARLLAEREAALEATQTDLAATTEKARTLESSQAELEARQAALAEEKARLEAERSQLAERFDRTRSELEAAKNEQVEMVNTLGQLREASSVSRERLTQSEAALRAREEELAAREAALQAAEAERARLAAEREALNRELEVARSERRMLEENLTREQAEKLNLQREKEEAFARADRLTEGVSELGQGVSQLGQGVSQLGQGVSDLTQTSQAMQEELEAARPQTMSEIFTRFQNNRASLRFTAQERTFLGGQTERSYESKSILIEDPNGAHFLVTHSENSPFAFGKNASSLLGVELTVTIGQRRFPVPQIGFLSADPRIIFVPLPESVVAASGMETFPLARQPERWEEAVLVKNDESNFGRTGFRRLTESEGFLKMDRPALGQLFADFASSQGDFAFSKNSRFIGLLTDTQHAVVIDDFLASGVLTLGDGFETQASANTLDRLRDRAQQLPAPVR
jgi:predicted nuclease with TOPRIM domain